MSEIVTVAKKNKGFAYAIRRKSDGLFSRGGAKPAWGKLPKVWNKGTFKNHLHQFGPNIYSMARSMEFDPDGPWHPAQYNAKDFVCGLIRRYKFPYLDCEVLVMDASSESHNMITVATYPAVDWIWEKAYRPHILNNTYCLERIRGFCVKHGIDLDKPDTIEDIETRTTEVTSVAEDNSWYSLTIDVQLEGAKHFPDEAGFIDLLRQATGATAIKSQGMIFKKK